MAVDEREFKDWYGGVAKKLKINPNPDDPGHHYDYRAFYQGMKNGTERSPATRGKN